MASTSNVRIFSRTPYIFLSLFSFFSELYFSCFLLRLSATLFRFARRRHAGYARSTVHPRTVAFVQANEQNALTRTNESSLFHCKSFRANCFQTGEKRAPSTNPFDSLVKSNLPLHPLLFLIRFFNCVTNRTLDWFYPAFSFFLRALFFRLFQDCPAA